MIAKIYIEGVIGEDVVLLDVIRQFKSFKNPESIEVHINSVGGSVDVGQSIFLYLRNLEVPVKTVGHMAYSIAASIFMAGDIREVPAGADRIMIHMPFAQGANGSSKDLESLSKQLKAIEIEFVKFYSTYTAVDEDTVRSLLENEQFLTAQEAYDLGIATVVSTPLAAVAYYNEDNTKITNVIMKNADKLMVALKSFLKPEEALFVALVLQDANGIEIDFPEVAEDATPEIGDKAQVDNKPAEGEYVSPEGAKWVFENGSLMEVIPAEAAPEDAPVEEAAVVEQPEASYAEVLEEMFSRAKLEITKEMTAKFEAISKENKDLNAEIISLKKLIGSSDVDVADVDAPNPVQLSAKFNRAAQILNSRKRK